MATEMEKYETDPQIVQATSQALALKAAAQKIEITTDETDRQAKDLLIQVDSVKKGLESLRKSFVQPLNEHVKNINAFFKERGAPIESADRIIRDKAAQYFRVKLEIARKERERQERLAAKRQETADKKAQEEGLDAAPPVAIPVPEEPEKTTRTEAGTVTMKKRWDFTIACEEDIPREYLVPDLVKIRAVVNAGLRNIPGITIFETEDVSVRR